MGSAEVVVDVVVEDLVVAAEAVVEVEEAVEADQEIGRAKTAVTPTLPGGTLATAVSYHCAHSISHLLTVCFNSSL